jgi:RNA polymerase sigma factor (sigma-70 family)
MREEDFDRLYADHAQPLFGFLVYRTGDRTLAEDLLADTFERAMRGRRGFDRRRASEKTWLYAIALNTLRDHKRREAAESRALERSGVAKTAYHESAIESVESRDDLMRVLGMLTAEERETIALRYGADLTVPEIAKLTRERLTTIEGRVYRALRKLRAELARADRAPR